MSESLSETLSDTASDTVVRPSLEQLEILAVEALRGVYDPEIPVNIYDLGLIYELTVNPDYTIYCKMTLTAPNCPAAGILPGQAEAALQAVSGADDARVELVFDPPYTLEMMSEEAKLELGFM